VRGILPLVLLLVVVPATVTAVLLLWGGGGRVVHGDQPGGAVTGRLVDHDGAPVADEPISGWIVSPLGERARVVEGLSAADGRFQLELPATRGTYMVRLGGGACLPRELALSTLGREEGEAPREMEVRLRRGGTLVLELADPARGSWSVRPADPGAAPAPVEWRKSGRFDGARIEVPGLPAVDALVQLEFEDGVRWECELRLPERGTTVRVAR
jgi:hypothetical protein